MSETRRRRKSSRAALAEVETDAIFSGARQAAPSAPGSVPEATPGEEEAEPPPTMGDGYERIIEHIFEIDPFAEYHSAVEELTIGRQHVAQGAVKQEIDRAEHRALRAHRLYVAAKLAHERFKIDSAVIQGALWDGATAELQTEKDGGIRSKAITNDDVRYKAAQLYPDEWRSNESRMKKAELMLKHLSALADLWQSRCSSLRKLKED